MRCGCPHCQAFMIQQEGNASVCVCPECGYRCDACLGTGTALTRDQLERLKGTDWFTPNFDGGTEPEQTMGFTAERPDAPKGF